MSVAFSIVPSPASHHPHRVPDVATLKAQLHRLLRGRAQPLLPPYRWPAAFAERMESAGDAGFFDGTDDFLTAPGSQPFGWQLRRALRKLKITLVPFRAWTDGINGYAHHREIAISPLALHPCATAVHEMAHVLLGHTTDDELRAYSTIVRVKSFAECEAEAVTWICARMFGFRGMTERRSADYIRAFGKRYRREGLFSDESVARIQSVAQRILDAGWVGV